MAVNMGGSDTPAVADRVSLITFAEEHSGLLIGLAVVVVVFLLYKHNQANTSATPAQQDLSGLATNANGQPIVYVPTSTYFNTDNSVNATDNTAPVSIDSPTTSTTTAPVVTPPTGTPGTGGVRPPPVHPVQILIVRAQRPGDASDLKNHGVAIRSTPGGQQIAVAPFGQALTITGNGPVTGPSNGFKGGGPSSTTWYLTNLGYISAIDTASVS